jgi:hypothetical protein
VSEQDRDYGPAPDTEAIAELLSERYPIKKDERITAETSTSKDSQPLVTVTLTSGRNIYLITVEYLRGAGERDAWEMVVDAADALFGTLIENGRDYRELPQGSDVEYDGAFFRVEASREVPDLSDKADQLLNPRRS